MNTEPFQFSGNVRAVPAIPHKYPPGWTTENVDINGPFGWTEGGVEDPSQHVDLMGAWRFCPVCGEILLAADEVATSEPQCSGCYRPVEYCPCACKEDHLHAAS